MSYNFEQRYNHSAKVLRRAPNIKKNLIWLNKIQESPCEDCGQSFPRACMDFHHINENEKHKVLKRVNGFTIRRMVMSGYGIKTLKKEVSKCAIICSNCHRIRHHHKDESHKEENESSTLDAFFE